MTEAVASGRHIDICRDEGSVLARGAASEDLVEVSSCSRLSGSG